MLRVSIPKALSLLVAVSFALAADAQITANQFSIQDAGGLFTGRSATYTINAKNAVGFTCVYRPPTQAGGASTVTLNAAYVVNKPFQGDNTAIWVIVLAFPDVPAAGHYAACSSTDSSCFPPLLNVAFFHNTAGGNIVQPTGGSFDISQVAIDSGRVTQIAGTFALKIKVGSRTASPTGTFAFDETLPGGPRANQGGAGGGTGGSGGGTGGTGGGTGGGTPTTPATPAITFADGFFDSAVGLNNGQSVAVPFSVFVPDGFSNDVTLSASSSPDGLGLTFDNASLPAPGSGDRVLTISAGPDTFPVDRQVAITATFNDANGNPVTSTSTFTVSLFCDPPMILGLNQPKNTTVSGGTAATLSVTPGGSGPFTYQWYAGSTGQTHFPVADATSRTFATPPVSAAKSYWVRVTNACGTADSQTAVVGSK